MSIRTPEELTDRIAGDLIWRKKELSILKALLSTAQADRKPTLLRSLITLLYAHWEGFVKNASQSYLEYIHRRRLAYHNLASNFVALSLENRIRDALRQRNLGSLIEIIDLFRSGLEVRSSIPHKETIDAESNLSSRVLRDITTSLGIDFAFFETKAVLIDERLLKSRNQIAHGEYLVIDADAALELAEEIHAMMEQYRNLIENAVVLQQYRHSESN